MEKLIDNLEEAKKNVAWLLDHQSGLVDMHGISYWASEIEKLRGEISLYL